MQQISSHRYHMTSVSMRPTSKRRLVAALLIIRRNGLDWSESELLRQLGKLYLDCWRGNERKSATCRRYSRRLGTQKTVRVAWYADQVLYSILWQRAIHSGESVSRMLDFAIRHYLPRLLEDCLRSPRRGCARAARNARYWGGRYEKRRNHREETFITYQCRTEKNAYTGLRYVQEYTIFRKNELSAGDILYLRQHAA